MRLPWKKAPDAQLDLLDAQLDAVSPAISAGDEAQATESPARGMCEPGQRAAIASTGLPLLVSIALIDEDPDNPRTEFPDAEIDELADDIRQRGILQPLIVRPADAKGRHRLHFGAKRLRAALRAGLSEVPVVVRDAPADAYDQVAENQKRHALTPLDLARFIKSRVDAGESNATIAKRLGMDLTSVAHHLALLELPPELNEAMHAGRCTSPRTLYELSQLHRSEPGRVQALLNGDAEITRSAVSAVRAESLPTTKAARTQPQRPRPVLLVVALTACERLESALDRIAKSEPRLVEADLASLKQRIADLASRLV